MVPWWDLIIWANRNSQMMALLEFLYCDLILWCGNSFGTMASFYDVRSYNMATLKSFFFFFFFFFFSNFLGCCCSFIFSFLFFLLSTYGIWWSAYVITFLNFIGLDVWMKMSLIISYWIRYIIFFFFFFYRLSKQLFFDDNLILSNQLM